MIGQRRILMHDQYTSTGSKFGHHLDSFDSHFCGEGNSVISTHIAPEGGCNLTCSYCSVHNRKNVRIKFDTIMKYVDDLITRGLKAVILTGGGEPMAYPGIEFLLKSLVERGLEVGLITNGTLFHKVSDCVLKQLTWIRVSINKFEGFEERIKMPSLEVRETITLGLSMVYDSSIGQEKDLLLYALALKRKYRAKYLRVVTNCLLRGEEYEGKRKVAINAMKVWGDDQTFFQGRHHQAPDALTCKMGYFRPYLSEVVHPETSQPGAVFPCDSIPLHHSQGYFDTHWSICSPSQILDYLDGKIKNKFRPHECEGCLFTQHVELIDQYGDGRPMPVVEGTEEHVNFV